MEIVQATPEEASALLEALSREMDALYGDSGSARFTHWRCFVIAREGEVLLGCGALVDYDERTLEVKRMYVAPAARGRGVGRAILAALEHRATGFDRLILETGNLQPEAIKLYEGAGFKPIESYGPFVRNPQSLCFEKPLLTANPPPPLQQACNTPD